MSTTLILLLFLVTRANLIVADPVSGIYDSSTTPANLPWNTYNYCNAPHVNYQHYTLPGNTTAKLVYLNIVIRHHKRTPDNLFPSEKMLNIPAGWDCSDFVQEIYGGSTTQINRQTVIPSWHPYSNTIWNGTCDSGQLTRQGLDDSVRHGKDFWSVYHKKLGFLKSVNERDILIRTSTELRTVQVAGGILYGMDPKRKKKPFPVYSQPQTIDSIVPNYYCPAADSIRSAYQSIPAWNNHLEANRNLKGRLDSILGTAGLSSWSSWYDHFFDAFWSFSLSSSLRSRNYVRFEELTRPTAFAHLLEEGSTQSTQNTKPYSSLCNGAFYKLVDKLRSISRQTTWSVIRHAYRELSFRLETEGTRDWLERTLALHSNVPGVTANVSVEQWLSDKTAEGHLRPKDGVEGKYIICKVR